MLQDDWETKFVNLDAEENWELLISRLKQAEHECIPKKKSGQIRKYKPLWMNAKTLDKVRKKQGLEKVPTDKGMERLPRLHQS